MGVDVFLSSYVKNSSEMKWTDSTKDVVVSFYFFFE